MNRRDILKIAFGLGILSLFPALFRRSLRSSSRADVVFSLPENMSFHEYLQNINLWVDVTMFEDIQRKYQAAGRIVSVEMNKLSSNTLSNTFHFVNDDSLMSFLNEIGGRCNYNFEARANLGIKTTTYINGQIKNFQKWPVIKG